MKILKYGLQVAGVLSVLAFVALYHGPLTAEQMFSSAFATATATMFLALFSSRH